MEPLRYKNQMKWKGDWTIAQNRDYLKAAAHQVINQSEWIDGTWLYITYFRDGNIITQIKNQYNDNLPKKSLIHVVSGNIDVHSDFELLITNLVERFLESISGSEAATLDINQLETI